MKEKILLDTDIGTEVDDAITLAYLLANPKCDLAGITTSCGESIKRAEMASMLCRAAGRRDIPIHAGCERPLLVEQVEKYAPQAAVLEQWDHDTGFKPNTAVPFMQKLIRDNPGEITILCIAPLTNLGTLFAIDPEIPSLLKGVMMLCGNPTQQRFDLATEGLSAMDRDDLVRVFASRGILENNSIVDPHSTSLVYRAPVKSHRTIGVNCSSVPVMTPEESKERFGHHPLLRAVMAIASLWFKDDPHMSFHDPLAGVCLFHDDVCEFERGDIAIELESRMLAGFTYWRPNPAGAHLVAKSVDQERFFRHLFEVFK